MKAGMKGLAVSALILATAMAGAQDKAKEKLKPRYLPIDTTVGATTVWDLSQMPATNASTMDYADHGFNYFGLQAALKLGINYVGVEAEGDYSVLYAESRRYNVVPVKLKVNGGSDYSGVAYVGVACRVNVLTKGGRLDLAVAGAGAELGVKIKAISESLSFSAIGFTAYAPLKLEMNADGTVNLGAIRKGVIDVFNEYSKIEGDLSKVVPKILGIRVGEDFPDLAKVTKIQVLPG